MQRIATSTAIVNKFGNEPTFGYARNGFGDGDPNALPVPQSSTQLDATMFDNLQEEIARTIELSGLPLNPADLTQLWQAINRAVGSGPFVLKAGDTMTGGLQTPYVSSTGDAFVAGTFVVGSANSPGAISCAGPTDVSGAITSHHGRFIAASPTGDASISLWNHTIPMPAAGMLLGSEGTLHFANLDGQGAWVASRMTLSPTFTLSVFGNVEAVQVFRINGGVAGAEFYSANGGTAIRFALQPDQTYWQLGFLSSLLAYTTPPYPVGGGAWSCDSNGNTGQVGNCGAPSYNPISDERTKENVRPWNDRGLADIIQLQPVSFQYNGTGMTPDDSKTGIVRYGVTAQDALPHLPEAVVAMEPVPGGEAPEQNLTLPDQLTFSFTTLLYASVNAFKEIDQRLRALEGATITPRS